MRLISVGRYLLAGFGVLSLVKEISNGKGAVKEEDNKNYGMEIFDPSYEWTFKGEAKDLMAMYMTMNNIMDSENYISARGLLDFATKNHLTTTEDICMSVLMNTQIDKYGWTKDEWDPQFKELDDGVVLYYGKPFRLA